VNGEPIELKMDDGDKYEPVSIQFFLWHGKELQEMKYSLIHKDFQSSILEILYYGRYD